ncbi:DUF7520 family protein [Haloprofundus halophilus]|uniref:DUF7520 family protein n=1 Tax=Haloprofundus halophilus TaxID=2283527 RepID=UPI001E6448D4|nr:hypothetical protein [Haloprofundus halophilus]
MNELDVKESGRGRRILLGVGGVVVLVAALIGLFVGENSAGASIDLLGVATLPVSPIPMALYGAVLATVALGALFGAVEFVSRVEERDRV